MPDNPDDDETKKGSGLYPRSQYKDRRHKDFEKGLKRLGTQDRLRSLAGLVRFIREWADGVPVDELGRDHRWRCRGLKGSVAKRFQIKEMEPSHGVRVILFFCHDAPPEIWFLDIMDKKNFDDPAIARAASRAQEVVNERAKK